MPQRDPDPRGCPYLPKPDAREHQTRTSHSAHRYSASPAPQRNGTRDATADVHLLVSPNWESFSYPHSVENYNGVSAALLIIKLPEKTYFTGLTDASECPDQLHCLT